MNHKQLIGAAIVALAAAHAASASIVTYFNDHAGWSAAAGPTTMIDFVPPSGSAQVVSGTHYQDLGVTLSGSWTTDPVAWSLLPYGSSADGWGGRPSGYPTTVMGALNFSEPIRAFAMDKLTALQASVHFYQRGSLVATGWIQVPQGQFSQNHFFGWITDFDFDRIVFNSGSTGGADNIYFSTIPAPGAAPLLFAALVAGGRRRRR